MAELAELPELVAPYGERPGVPRRAGDPRDGGLARCTGAASSNRDGVALVDPAKLNWELARVVRSLGVRVHEHSPVTGLEATAVRGRGAHARTRRCTARQVAIGTSAFPNLLRRVRPFVIPVYDYALMTEPLTADAVGQHRMGVPRWRRRQQQPVPLHPARRPTAACSGAASRPSTTTAAGWVRALNRDDAHQCGARRELLRDLPAARGPAVLARVGRGDRHLLPLQRLLGHGDGWPRGLQRRVHRPRRRRHPLRRPGDARPARRPRDRAHPA